MNTSLSHNFLYGFQNIVYNGYLKSFLDESIFDLYQLGSCLDSGCQYNASINPSITNEWGIANR